MRQALVPAVMALLIASALVSACSSQDKPAPTPPASALSDSGELSPQQLGPGECGLFLWTHAQPNRFIFFSRAGTDTAIMRLKGAEKPLTLVQRRGGLFGQFMTDMRFNSDAGTITISFVPGAELDGGQRIDSGRISIVGKEGWETLIPVYGLSACEPGSR
ncbi:hypothetical protein [Hyphomonas johnsonii]|uniref:Lipoprotein n=1 Tax=Hyphomonas johnsonii MHS-2 TaxID=1280950 RepID=A0A059FUL1_9PROT|nr:hypothetical protein [Hyphomonas johnsonii]KCZ94297.1 hypothetical protein HJO_02945 [Hyphomonas johnsonii MHS-2]